MKINYYGFRDADSCFGTKKLAFDLSNIVSYVTVCSTTLWVGHLSKLVQETDLSDTFGEYGDIVSIDLIPPRGCAFIQMNRRQDADRALHKLKNTKIQGKAITV